jgi:hypothetical protein
VSEAKSQLAKAQKKDAWWWRKEPKLTTHKAKDSELRGKKYIPAAASEMQVRKEGGTSVVGGGKNWRTREPNVMPLSSTPVQNAGREVGW